MKRYIHNSIDWYGSALGYSDEELEKIYITQAILSDIDDNIPGGEYEPISYGRDSNNEVVIHGEVTLGDDIFPVTVKLEDTPGKSIKNFLKILCDKYHLNYVDSIDDALAAINEYLSNE